MAFLPLIDHIGTTARGAPQGSKVHTMRDYLILFAALIGVGILAGYIVGKLLAPPPK